MFDLTGKTALVTGASGGIGGAIAEALHGAGATVALSGTREAPLRALADRLGERAHVVTANLGDAESVLALPKAAAEAMGSIDIWSTMPESRATTCSCACRMTNGRRCWT